jgi:hypothetical protein
MKLLTYFAAILATIAGISATNLPPATPSSNSILKCELCDTKINYAIKPNYIKIGPYPPKSSSTVNVELSGNLDKVIEQGAMVDVTVNAGFVTRSIKIDICKQSAIGGLPCPIQPGEHTITLPIAIPWIPFRLNGVPMTATIKNIDQSILFCFKSKIDIV